MVVPHVQCKLPPTPTPVSSGPPPSPGHTWGHGAVRWSLKLWQSASTRPLLRLYTKTLATPAAQCHVASLIRARTDYSESAQLQCPQCHLNLIAALRTITTLHLIKHIYYLRWASIVIVTTATIARWQPQVGCSQHHDQLPLAEQQPQEVRRGRLGSAQSGDSPTPSYSQLTDVPSFTSFKTFLFGSCQKFSGKTIIFFPELLKRVISNLELLRNPVSR